MSISECSRMEAHQRHSVPPVQHIVIEDCEGWCLSGCCGSVAEHWQLKPEMSWVGLQVTAGLFTFLYFHIITSELSLRQDALSIDGNKMDHKTTFSLANGLTRNIADAPPKSLAS